LFFARSAKKLDSLDFSLPCRAANDFLILACAANDFTVSHETNSLPGNKMYDGARKEVFTSKIYLPIAPCFVFLEQTYRIKEIKLFLRRARTGSLVQRRFDISYSWWCF
jgi:hypothetical protein